MNKNSGNSQNHKQKKPIQILRERRGGAPTELVERNHVQKKLQGKLADALKEKTMTGPELAQATGIPIHEVFWHLMSMMKYGKIIEGEERDGYYEYSGKLQKEENE